VDNGIAILFHMVSSSQQYGPEYTLSVPSSEADMPAGLANTAFLWSDHQISIAAFTNDKAHLWEYEWPDDGYLAKILFQCDEKGENIESDTLFTYAHEFVLTDGENREYIPFKTLKHSILDDVCTFSLIYSVGNIPVPSVDELGITIQPRPVMWVDPLARMNTQPFRSFVPDNPTDYTVAVFLDPASRYEFGSVDAILNPEEALDTLSRDLRDVRMDLMSFLPEKTIITDNPDLASVMIGIRISYQYAGKYGAAGTAGTVDAYNCLLTVTAYDARTREVLEEYTAGNYFGNAIAATSSTVVWHDIPRIIDGSGNNNDARRAFADQLRDFWEGDD
jgi:hypothetical protein